MPATPRPSSVDYYRQASLVRIASLSIWIAIIATTHFDRYSTLPQAERVQRGLAGILLTLEPLAALPDSVEGMSILKWSTMLGLAALLLWPRRLRHAGPGVFVGILILDSISKEYNGYANHGQLVPLILAGLFLLAVPVRFASIAEVWQRKTLVNRSPYAELLAAAGLVIVVPYTFIGLTRLTNGGLDLFRGDALLDAIRRDSLRNSNFGFRWFVDAVETHWFAAVLKCGFAITTAAELMSALVFVSARFRTIWVIVMVGFHVMTLLSMNILFWENMILTALVFGVVLRPTTYQAKSAAELFRSRHSGADPVGEMSV